MKALVKVMACLCLATVMAGFAYAHLSAEPDYIVVEKTFKETIRSTDTIDSILEHYYDKDLHGHWGEWKFGILHLPENKHLLNENGYLKTYHPGEKLTITCKVRVAK